MMLKIASYNLWSGAADTYNRLVEFIEAQKFDVLCLQETNGWQDNDFARMKDFADRADFTDYQYGNSNSEYKLATFSKVPITKRVVHVEGFWHCAVETHVAFNGTELVIVNLHLDPWKEDPRLREVERLMRLIDISKPTIIAGDFNSVSRRDNYPPKFLARLQELHFTKFGANELDYRVTGFLESAGFVDVGAQLGHLDITVPTPYGAVTAKESMPATEAPARIDYAYASASLVPYVQSFEVIKTAETDKISDHYPLILTLDDSPPASSATLGVNRSAPPESEPAPTTADEPRNTATEGEIKLH